MGRFKNQYENLVNSFNLKRVKIKVDPKYATNPNWSDVSSYTGYILSEENEMYTIYFENLLGGIIKDIPIAAVQTVVHLSKLDQLKAIVINELIEKKNLTAEDPLVSLILQSPSIESIEQFMLDNGCPRDYLINIYRNFYLNNE